MGLIRNSETSGGFATHGELLGESKVITQTPYLTLALKLMRNISQKVMECTDGSTILVESRILQCLHATLPFEIIRFIS